MSEFARLKDILEKLRQRERAPGEGRKLRGTTAQGFLASLIAEIDETILPRRLVFNVDDRVEIHLAVANRRLQAMLSPAPDVQVEIGKELLDHAFVGVDDQMVAVLGSILLTALEGAQTVKVLAYRQTQLTYDPDVGALAHLLFEIWDVQPEEEVVQDPSALLDGFLSELGEDAIGWLRIEGEDVTDQGGMEEVVATLGDHAAYFLDGYFSKFDALFPPETTYCTTLIAPSLPNGPATFFVEAGKSSAFIAVPTENAVALSTRWQAMIAD